LVYRSACLFFAVILRPATCLSYDPRELPHLRVIRKSYLTIHLDTFGVNDHEPLPALNPYADRVSYSPVFHQIKLCAELEYTQGQGGERRRSLWGLSRRTRAIDHLLYEINGGFWRWVTGGRGNVLSIGVVVIANTRPQP